MTTLRVSTEKPLRRLNLLSVKVMQVSGQKHIQTSKTSRSGFLNFLSISLFERIVIGTNAKLCRGDCPYQLSLSVLNYGQATHPLSHHKPKNNQKLNHFNFFKSFKLALCKKKKDMVVFSNGLSLLCLSLRERI